jgi:hypothetical protein
MTLKYILAVSGLSFDIFGVVFLAIGAFKTDGASIRRHLEKGKTIDTHKKTFKEDRHVDSQAHRLKRPT